MLEIVGLVLLVQLSIIIVFLYILSRKLQHFTAYVKEVIDTKLKTKWDLINEMPVKEAKKWDIRVQSEIKRWIDYASIAIANKVGQMLGGKKGRGGYAEGGR